MALPSSDTALDIAVNGLPALLLYDAVNGPNVSSTPLDIAINGLPALTLFTWTGSGGGGGVQHVVHVGRKQRGF